MASEITVQTIRGPASGANANKILIPAGQTLDASSGFIPPSGSVLRVYGASTENGVQGSGTTPFSLGLTWTDVVVNAGETPYLNLFTSLRLIGGTYCHAAVQLKYTGSASGNIGDFTWGLGIEYQDVSWGTYSISNLNMRTVRGAARNFGTNTGTFTFTAYGTSTGTVGFGAETGNTGAPYAHLQGSIVIVKD